MSATTPSGTTGEPTAPPPAKPTIVRRGSGRTGLYAVVAVVVLVVLVVIVGWQLHWFGGKSSSGPGSCVSGVTLQGNGANFIAALAATWTTAYAAKTSNQVNYVAGGAGAGLSALSSKPPTVDFAATDNPLSPTQRAALGSPALTIPVTGGALAIVYNLPGIGSGLNLSGAVLADIYLGKVTTWNNPAIANNNTHLTLPGNTIQTVHRSDSAGTTFVLTDKLSRDSPGWSSTVGKGMSVSFPSAPAQVAIKGNAALLSYVQTTTYTIGYVDLTDVLTASTVQSYAAIQNPAGNFILPTIANTASAIADQSAKTTFPASSGDWWNVSMVNAPGSGDYPLSTFAYFFVYQHADQGYNPSVNRTQVLIQWLNWVLGPGQQYSNGLYYTALASDVISIDQTGLSTMTFNGAAVPSCT